MTNDVIRVLFVDDNERLTAAWARLIAQQSDMRLAGTLHRADELIEFVSRGDVDIVLIDLTMDGRDALDAIAELGKVSPSTRVVVCSGQSRDPWEHRAKEAGAAEFVDKIEAPATILETIRRVARAGAPRPS